MKIDILASNLSEVPSSSDSNSKQNFQTSAKIVSMTALDELNVIGHEIDRQTTKKTAETLELLTELLSGAMEKNTFLAKMKEGTDTTLADLLAISRKLVKRHKFEVNPNLKEFMRIKHLQFPTSSKDLGELNLNVWNLSWFLLSYLKSSSKKFEALYNLGFSNDFYSLFAHERLNFLTLLSSVKTKSSIIFENSELRSYKPSNWMMKTQKL